MRDERFSLIEIKCEDATELPGIGVKDRSITQPRVIFIRGPPPPSERRDLWGVGTVYSRTLTYPLHFSTYLGNRGDTRVQGRTRTRF